MQGSRLVASIGLLSLMSFASAASDFKTSRRLFQRQISASQSTCTCPAPDTTVYAVAMTTTSTATVAVSGTITTSADPITQTTVSTSTITISETAPATTITTCSDRTFVKRQATFSTSTSVPTTGTTGSGITLYTSIMFTETITSTTTINTIETIPPQGTFTSVSVVSVTVTSTTTPTESYCPPISYQTITSSQTGTVVQTATLTSTVNPTGSEPGTVYVILPNAFAETTTVAAFSCPTNGYMVTVETGVPILYSVDIATGVRTTVKSPLGDGTSINAIGYNSLDERLYGVANYTTPRVIRIGSDGAIANVRTIPRSSIGPWNSGDVDENGDFWVGVSGREFVQVKLSTLAIIASGTINNPTAVYDWAYVPGGGNYLYAISVDSSGRTFLNRFDRDTKTFSRVGTGYGAVYPANGIVGAVYASQDGFLYGSENGGGKVYRFSLDGTTSAYLSTGRSASSNDGAHCINNNAT